MNLRNLLYKQQYRSHKNYQIPDQNEYHDQQYQMQLEAIQNSLTMMNTAFKNNIKIQQIYLDLFKARTRKVNFKQKDIKNIYKILSENKTGEIIFSQAFEKDENERRENSLMVNTMKDQTSLMTSSLNSSRFKELAAQFSGNERIQNKNIHKPNGAEPKVKFRQTQRNSLQPQGQKMRNTDNLNETGYINTYRNYCIKMLMLTYRRLYSRLVQATIKKLTYYILNKQYLQKIILHTISEQIKRLETLMRRIFDFRDFKFLFEVIKLIYEENFIIQQKIYELLVNEGHVVSMEEFFRINGISIEENQTIRRRSSRISALPVQRLNVLSNQPICPDQLKADSKPKQSRFNPQAKRKSNTKDIKEKKDKKDKHLSTQNQNKNIVYIERINKEIESKYAAALEKLGDLIEKGNQDLALFQNKDTQQFKKKDDQLSKRKDSEQNEEPGNEKFVRSKSKNKSISTRKRTSTFQYFSSSFKQIIKELDEKKGKASQFQMESQQSNQDQKDLIMLKGASNLLQSVQFQKINNETISLQNPINVARLLSKKFKTLMPHSKQRTTYSLMSKKMPYSSNSNRHNPIGNLLKIYESKNKQSHIIDILFGTNFKDQDHKNLQRNFIKLSIMAKLKEKKIEQLQENQLEYAKFEDFMMKEVEQEYEQLLAFKRNKKERKTEGARFQSYFQQGTSQAKSPQQKNSQKKRKTVDLDKPQEKSIQEEHNQKDQEAFFKTEVQTQLNQLELKSKNQSPNESGSKLKSLLQSTRRTFRMTHQPNFSQTQMPLASHLSMFQCFQSKQFKKFENTYGEFTNPLTKTTGYYNQKNYTSLRTSLEKLQLNSIFKLKKKVENINLFDIGSNVSFLNTIRKPQQKGNRKITTKLSLENVNEQKTQNANESLLKLKHEQSTEKTNGLNLFEHQVLKKFVKWQKENHPDGREIAKTMKIKPQRPTELKVLRIQHSKTQSDSLKKLSRHQNFRQTKEIHKIAQKKLFDKISSSQSNTLNREFCLNAKKIQKPNFELNQDHLDGFIEKYFQSNKAIEASYGNYGKVNESFVMKDFSKAINSLPVSPRHSFKRMKELYSTHRRTKVQ